MSNFLNYLLCDTLSINLIYSNLIIFQYFSVIIFRKGNDLIFGDETVENYEGEIFKLIEDMTNEVEFDSRPTCYEILHTLKLLKLNWDRVKDFYKDDSDHLLNLELDDIFINILTESDENNKLSIKRSPSSSILKRKGKLRLVKSERNKQSRAIYKSDYDEQELFRTGGFGFIFKSKHKHDLYVYAIKKYYLGGKFN